MKDIFDECQLGELKLNSRIVRTGTWETETEDGGFICPEGCQDAEMVPAESYESRGKSSCRLSEFQV